MSNLLSGDFLRPLGAVCTTLIVVVAAVIQFTGPFEPGNSVSQAWSRSKFCRLLMAFVLTFAGAGLCLYIIKWVIPEYNLAHWMYWLAGLGYVAVLAIAWIPITEKPGDHAWFHPHFLGGAFAATGGAIALLSIVFAHPPVPTFSRIISIIGFAICAAWPVAFLPKVIRYFLIFEIAVAMSFSAAMVALAFGV